jgi:tetratricopeptide (TPR) repeat protein
MFRSILVLGFLTSLFFSISLSQKSKSELESSLQQNPNDIESLIALGRIYHDEAAQNDSKAVDKGFECFDKALELDPHNALALAYRGSLWTMRGRDAWFPFTKLKHVDHGIDEMDKAADLAPENFTIHMVRGINSVQLPNLFHRLGTALKDFTFLMEQQQFPHLNAQLQSTIYYWAGIAYKRDDQNDRAKEYLEKAIAVAPGSATAKNAEKELKEPS